MNSIIDTFIEMQELETFSAALQVSGLDRDLNSDEDFTIFAPNNRAFTQLSRTTLQQLSENISLLIKVIGTHIIRGKLSQQDFVAMSDLGSCTVVWTLLAELAIAIDLSNGMNIERSIFLAAGKFTDRAIVDPIDLGVNSIGQYKIRSHQNPFSFLLAIGLNDLAWSTLRDRHQDRRASRIDTLL